MFITIYITYEFVTFIFLFLRILNDLKQLTIDNIKENSMLLMSLIITCCDLSDQVRPWPTTQNVAVKKKKQIN